MFSEPDDIKAYNDGFDDGYNAGYDRATEVWLDKLTELSLKLKEIQHEMYRELNRDKK